MSVRPAAPKIAMTVKSTLLSVDVFFIFIFSLSVCCGLMIAFRKAGINDADCLKQHQYLKGQGLSHSLKCPVSGLLYKIPVDSVTFVPGLVVGD